jgi:hypothetical protein
MDRHGDFRIDVCANPLLDPLTRIIHEYRREAAETKAWRGFSQVRATQADLRSVETEREKPRQTMGSAAVAGIHELSGFKLVFSTFRLFQQSMTSDVRFFRRNSFLWRG